jgi:hypothetical protein
MARTATKPKTALSNDREALAEELLRIERKQADDNARKKEIKSELIAHAGNEGHSLKIEIAGLGVVKVSPAHGAEAKGMEPVVQAAFLEASEKEREKVIAKGFIKMEVVYGKPYYGAVTPDLY